MSPTDTIAEFVSQAVVWPKTFIGIDPGATGALGLIAGSVYTAVDIPTIDVARKRSRKTTGEEFAATGKATKTTEGTTVKFDYPGIVGLFRLLKPLRGRLYIALEQAQVQVSGKKSSPTYTAFRVGISYGMWPLYLSSLGIPVEEFTPAGWKAKMGLIGKDKEASRMKAQQLFPTAPLSRKKDKDRAEALLLAEYLRRLHGGK